MAKTKKYNGKYKLISLRRLSEKSGIDYQKIYNSLNNKYNGLDANERAILCNVAYEETEEFFKELGFQVNLKRITQIKA